MYIYTYKKNIFDMKNKFNQRLRMQSKLENKINLHCCVFKFVFNY